MPVCDNCGNDYDKAFQLIKEGKTYTFDSFECAIARLAPVCEHCQVRIIGHGLEAKGRFFCCAHCAEHHGVQGLTDRQWPGQLFAPAGWVWPGYAPGGAVCRAVAPAGELLSLGRQRK